MMPCRFIRIASWDGWECEVCHRRISSMTVAILNGQLLVAACGVPSDYDEPRQCVEQEPQRFVRRPLQSNELLGQEGGVWDRFYMEEA